MGKPNAALCFICQKRPRTAEDGLRCRECAAPKHVHNWQAFKFTPDAPVTYYACECGEQRMTAEER